MSDTYNQKNINFITSWAEDIIRTAHYILGPRCDEINFCCLIIMCHSMMGLTCCYKTAVSFTFYSPTQRGITYSHKMVHKNVSPLLRLTTSSYGDCLEVKREYYQNSSMMDCVTQCSQSAAHLYEQFLQVKQIGVFTLRPLRCA